MFETKIYLRDAVGHWDSVTIGYDLNDLPFDTTQFHEVLDNSPFDSVFEARVVQRTWNMIYQYPYEGDTYKRLITDAETAANAPWCTLGGSSILLIHAKYVPVTLYWDRDVFDAAHCRENAFFTPDKTPQIVEPNDWVDSGAPIIFSCASKADSMVCTLTTDYYWDGDPNHAPFLPYFSMREIEGLGMDSIAGIGLEFVFGSQYSPCRLISNTEMPAILSGARLAVHPNPTDGTFRIRNERSSALHSVQIIDSTSQLEWGQYGPEIVENGWVTCQAIGLPPGIYFIRLVWQDGYEKTQKLVIK